MRRIATRAIIADNNKLLLVKLNSHGKPLDFYCTIGGGLDEGEGLVEGLEREVMEETGIHANVGKLLCMQQFSDKQEHLEFFFHITNPDDFKNIDLTKTSHGVDEIAEIGFYDPKEVTVLPKFLSEISIDELINSNEVKFFNFL